MGPSHGHSRKNPAHNCAGCVAKCRLTLRNTGIEGDKSDGILKAVRNDDGPQIAAAKDHAASPHDDPSDIDVNHSDWSLIAVTKRERNRLQKHRRDPRPPATAEDLCKARHDETAKQHLLAEA